MPVARAYLRLSIIIALAPAIRSELVRVAMTRMRVAVSELLVIIIEFIIASVNVMSFISIAKLILKY